MKKLLTLAVLALLCGAPKYAQATLDGTPSTGSFTVVNVSSLAAASATGAITIISTTPSLGINLSVGSLQFKEGTQWRVGATTTTAATSLAAAINASAAPVSATLAGPTFAGKINLTAIDVGTLYNQVGLHSSTPTAVSMSAATLTGGQDNATVSVNNVGLRQGTDWFINDTASGTATSIATAINRSPSLNRLVEAEPLGAQVFLRSRLSAYPFPLASSAPNDLTRFAATMFGGTAGNNARFSCYLGYFDALPTSGYPAGCLLFLTSDPTHVYLSTQQVVNAGSWLAK